MWGDIGCRFGEVGRCLGQALISIAPALAGVVVWRPMKNKADSAVALLIIGQER